ncbi:M23 family metallopeptidase [Candidatus Tokpelaia sp.]|uniref:M23 family metallopeptidase n=1 Tax=Candidatus Tokpelaia sp. TaxID=2233777 RepID=UPI001239D68D|nr:M23 family metallopeptidase [Candidatus Tokpelaia sp.]KAA6404645.1 M23 family peptidase [Candidatus Tokpelaia sp.]
MVKNKGIHIYSDNEPALIMQGKRPPDRRQISARWLVGTFLTGLTSCSLMGVALFAALHGREQLATPPELLSSNAMPRRAADSDDDKGERLIPTRPRRNFDDKRQFELSTMQKIDGKEVIRSQAFELVDMNLAEEHAQKFAYPKFNALKLFSDAAPLPAAENAAQIYGTKVESEVILQSFNFPVAGADYGTADIINADEAEKLVQASIAHFTDSAAMLAALRNIDGRHLPGYASFGLASLPDVKITQENVSILNSYATAAPLENYSEDIIPFARSESLLAALEHADYQQEEVQHLVDILVEMTDDTTLPAGSVLRLGIESGPAGQNRIVRASIYEDKQHVLSVALNDKGDYIRCNEPEITPVLRTALEGRAPVIRVAHDKLPTVYEAVFQSALAYDMTPDIAKQLIRMLANDVDLQSHISSNDSLSVFYPLPETGESKPERDILYVKADFGGMIRRYYRFQSDDGRVDYYDPEGKSSKQFLLRKPVPNAVFASPFGTRRHPVLGYFRSHTGVDWAAPRGSPILASGDGEIIKVGWSSGYGNHTEIRHANGYVTSYSHQSAFAPGIRAGAHVHQGQVIGYIGSTGLSTGPHCHFEMIVNGTKVDPMRIRLPDSKSLKGEQLEAFKRERDKIDSLINDKDAGNTRLASATPF